MDLTDTVRPLLGGALIGLSAAVLFLVNGRIAGVSGIVGGLLGRLPDARWRTLFVAGLVTGGAVLRLAAAAPFQGLAATPAGILVAAGLLVGFGSSLGSGCTSGHGVCGVSRLAPRSIAATLTFMGTGALTVFLVRHLLRIGP
jgi:hypothetical protein